MNNDRENGEVFDSAVAELRTRYKEEEVFDIVNNTRLLMKMLVLFDAPASDPLFLEAMRMYCNMTELSNSIVNRKLKKDKG